MKKQLLSLAMVFSVFAVGNVLAAGSGEGKATSSSETEKPEAPKTTTTTATTTNAPKTGVFSKAYGYVSAPFCWSWTNKYGMLAGAAVTVAAKLVYDYATNKPADVEEDEEDVEVETTEA